MIIPALVILFFIVAFIVWFRFMSKDKTMKVTKEGQIYNRRRAKNKKRKSRIFQRAPHSRVVRVESDKKAQKDKDKDVG